MLFFYCWRETKGDKEWREQKGLKLSVPKCGVICSVAGVIETWWVDCWVISFQHGCRHCQIYWHSRKSSLRRVLEVSLSPLCLSACLPAWRLPAWCLPDCPPVYCTYLLTLVSGPDSVVFFWCCCCCSFSSRVHFCVFFSPYLCWVCSMMLLLS